MSDTSKVAQLREMRERQVESSPTDPETFYADRVTASLAKTAQGFIETGRWLIEAKEELPHGRWTGWVEERLPISYQTANRFMKIAEGLESKFPNRGDLPLLPPAERTLYDLARLDDEEFERVRPKLSPEMTRSDLREILDDLREPEPEQPKSTEERADEVKRGEKSLSEAAAEEAVDDAIGALPEDERPRARNIIERPGVPKVDAVEMAQRVAAKPQEERIRLYSLNESEDEEERDLALTEAAGRPPMPHPAIDDLYVARIKLRSAQNKVEGNLHDDLDEVIEKVAEIDATLTAGGDDGER